MTEIPSTGITAPQAEIETLSFCAVEPGALADWVIGLPMANTADTAAQVRQATWEIARLDVTPAQRMALLEQIRPILHYLCARLDRNAATSSSQGDAIARLAQRLQTNLCSGYKHVVLGALTEYRTGAPGADPELIGLAVHRSLSDLSRTLLRTLQFYVEPADRLWFELNQLYLLAERLDIADEPIEDAQNHDAAQTSPANAYLRSLLLATCKPNQMRHRQLAEVFNCLETWSRFVALEADATSALFAVDLESDHGPVFKRLLRDAVQPRGIRTEGLVEQLDAHLRGAPSELHVPQGMSAEQLGHLASAWGEMHARAHRRADASGALKVTVGLRSMHYVLSGGIEFAELLDEPETAGAGELNPFLIERPPEPSRNPAVKDVWDDAFDLAPRIPVNPNINDPDRILRPPRRSAAADDGEPERPAYHIYDTVAVDTSPSGYQIRWNDTLPPHLQTGEILALRESGDSRWCVALIRWIRQSHDGTAMGIELLAPRANPVAVRVIRKVGGRSAFARALLLPELAPIGQPATLITPRVPFQEGQKIHLQEQGVRHTAQLTRCVLKTESVSQFTYRMLSGYLENAHPTRKMGDQ